MYISETQLSRHIIKLYIPLRRPIQMLRQQEILRHLTSTFHTHRRSASLNKRKKQKSHQKCQKHLTYCHQKQTLMHIKKPHARESTRAFNTNYPTNTLIIHHLRINLSLYY